MNPNKFIISMLCVFLLQGFSFAPHITLTIADRFYEKLDGTPEQKLRAVAGFNNWPRHYGHSQAEIYLLIEKETDGKFHCSAFNKKTQARGLMQVREIAIQDIPCGKEFYNLDGTLNRHKVYDPFFNIQLGSAYLKKCKQMAKAQKIGRFNFTKSEIALAYYVTGYGSWNMQISATLKYMQD